MKHLMPSVFEELKGWLKQRSDAFTEKSERVRFAPAQGNANLGVPFRLW